MKWLIAALAFCVVSCAVVNVYVTFPEEKIKKAADDLLGPAPADTGKQSFLKVSFGAEAQADEVSVTRDMKTSSPAMDQIKANRASWSSQLSGYEKAGYIGETMQFSVVLRDAPKDGNTASDVNSLIAKENRERDRMIAELMKINNAAAAQEKTFRTIFANTMIANYAPSGAWVQKASGEWVRK